MTDTPVTTYTVTVNNGAGEGGSISPSGDISVREDGDKKFTITAEFTAESTEQEPANGAKKNYFNDISPKNWFANDVMWVYENGLMLGVGDTIFAPDGMDPRGMIVTILHRFVVNVAK